MVADIGQFAGAGCAGIVNGCTAHVGMSSVCWELLSG
jgi:hypothetical protein